MKIVRIDIVLVQLSSLLTPWGFPKQVKEEVSVSHHMLARRLRNVNGHYCRSSVRFLL